MNIEYVSHSLGNRFKDTIELNENLIKYPKLHRAILDHELKHTDKLFSKNDFSLDFSESKVNQLELMKFMLRHPKSFYQFIPFYWTKKHGFVFDINQTLLYLGLLACIGVGVYLAI